MSGDKEKHSCLQNNRFLSFSFPTRLYRQNNPSFATTTEHDVYMLEVRLSGLKDEACSNLKRLSVLEVVLITYRYLVSRATDRMVVQFLSIKGKTS